MDSNLFIKKKRQFNAIWIDLELSKYNKTTLTNTNFLPFKKRNHGNIKPDKGKF